MTLQFLLLFLRYVAAVAVAFVASYVVLVPASLLFGLPGMLGVVLFFMIIGFCGVFSGALCLPELSRRFGSVILLALGLIYYCCDCMDSFRQDGNSFPFIWLIPLAGGGLIALILNWRQPFNNQDRLQPVR